jgi:DNA-binding NtrC family response regulator
MSSAKFLLVDNEKEFVEIITQYLRHRNFSVDCAFSVADALKRLEKEDNIDVVVLNTEISDREWIKTVEKLKKKYPLLEVIIITGDATVPSAIEAMKFGVFDYLSKPFDMNDFISKAIGAISKKKKREAEILDAKTKPYISEKERDELISSILDYH